MTLRESEVQKLMRIDASRKGNRLFRNNSGLYKTKDGRWVNIELAEGSSDLIGWAKIEITPDMVGKKIAVFSAIETKREGTDLKKIKGERMERQQQFIDMVQSHGGIAGFAQSNEDYEKILNDWLSEFSLGGTCRLLPARPAPNSCGKSCGKTRNVLPRAAQTLVK